MTARPEDAFHHAVFAMINVNLLVEMRKSEDQGVGEHRERLTLGIYSGEPSITVTSLFLFDAFVYPFCLLPLLCHFSMFVSAIVCPFSLGWFAYV